MSTPIAHHIAKPNKTPLIRARAGSRSSSGSKGASAASGISLLSVAVNAPRPAVERVECDSEKLLNVYPHEIFISSTFFCTYHMCDDGSSRNVTQ